GRQRDADARDLQRRPAALRCRGRGLSARLGLLLLHQRHVGAVVCRRRQRALRHQAARARMLHVAVHADREGRGRDPAHVAALRAAHREPRRTVRSTGRCRLRRRRRRARASVARRTTQVNIGIVCYASVGGSGIVATELAKALATRGHEVHLVSSETPFRLGEYQPGLAFHRVTTPAYPLFREPQYLLSLTNRIVQLSREFSLDVVHAHYAVPHATAAFLAKQILSSRPPSRVPKILTTLHGTDITLLGNDTSYSETVAFSLDASDGVTAVSESLKADTYRALRVRNDIRVIPNFLDCRQHGRVSVSDALRQRICRGTCEKLVIHVSNFRPVKRTDAVVRIFKRIREQLDARLLLVGEGPELDK